MLRNLLTPVFGSTMVLAVKNDEGNIAKVLLRACLRAATPSPCRAAPRGAACLCARPPKPLVDSSGGRSIPSRSQSSPPSHAPRQVRQALSSRVRLTAAPPTRAVLGGA